MSSLTDSDIRNLPAPIVEKLQSLISRVRRLIFLRGLFATIAAGLISILIIMAIDASFTLFSDVARWALSLCGLAFTLGIAWIFLLQPLSRKISLTHIARILETRHPELQERISSAVELMRSDDPDSIRGSQELIDEVVSSAVIDVKDVSPESEFDNSKVQRFFYIAVTTASIILVCLLIWPRQTGILFARAIAPFLDIGNAYSNTLTVDPGDIRIPIGETVTVKMSIKNKHIRRVTLRRSADEKSRESVERMTLLESKTDGTQIFTVTFPAVAESFRYRVNAGSAVSRYYQVDALPLPKVEKLTIHYVYPAYTGLKDLEIESENGDISAVEYTEVTVLAHLNKAVNQASLSINDTPHPAEAQIDAENQQVSWQFPLKSGLTGIWKLKLSDEDDFESVPATYAIHSLPDRAPEIAIKAPQIRELKLKRSESLPIKYSIKEDFGFSAVDLVVRRDGEAQPLLIPQPLPASSKAGIETWHGNARLDIGSLELHDKTRKLTVQIRVRDNLPAEYQGPHETLSDAITIILDANAQSLVKQAIEADRRKMEKALAQAKNELNQARSEIAQTEAQLKRSENLSPEATRELDQFREKAKSAHDTLRDISEKMQNTAFDRQAEQIKALAQNEVAKAREAANMIPLSDEKKERIENAQQAKKEVEKALKEIAEISKSLKDSQPEVQMVAKLNELANSQRQLAREAENRSQQAPPQPNEQELKKMAQDFAKWQQQQKNVQKQLGDILKENEAALKDVLKQQQQKAEELAKQAEQLAKEQQQIEKATEQASKENASEALRKQLLNNLAREQASIASDTKNKQRQESIKQQLESIKSGDLAEALTMQEEQLAQQAEQLAQETDALENDTQMAKQAGAQNRAKQAERQLLTAKAQADRASQQLTQAKQAQERAEQAQRQQKKDPAKTPLSPQSKQALTQSHASQKNAKNAFKSAAKELQQAAKELAKQAKKLSSEKMKSETLESKDLAESYQDVAKASDAKNDQQASDKAQKAADSLQQMAQAALEKLAGQNQSQQGEQDGSQQSDPRDSESEPQLSEGGKNPDMDGSGVPPELAKLGITFADWARMKGTLQSGSSNQGADAIPEEYRDLVQRYFRVIAAEAVKSE